MLEEFIDDVLGWAQAERRLKILPLDGPLTKTYFSQLIVEFSPQPVPPNATSLALMAAFGKAMESSGPPPVFTQMTGFTIGPDPASGANWGHRFERRVGAPFGANVFFSSAPLPTKIHKEMIREFEIISSGLPINSTSAKC